MVVEALQLERLGTPIDPLWHLPERMIRKEMRLISEYGQLEPVLVTPDLKIVGNDHVAEALRRLGAPHVDVVRINGLSDHQLKAVRIAFKRIPRDAKADNASLRQVLEELIDVKLDLTLTGMDVAEIDDALKIDIPEANVEETGADIPPLETVAVTMPGDVWAAGPHLVGCGNAREHKFVGSLLANRKADVAIVDPLITCASGLFRVGGSTSIATLSKVLANLRGPNL